MARRRTADELDDLHGAQSNRRPAPYDSARLAADINSLRHDELLSTSSGSSSSSSSAAAFAAIDARYPLPEVDAPYKAGDTHITFDSLANKKERNRVPREDGIYPRPEEPKRYGHDFQEEENRRRRALQDDPFYRFLEMFAGAAALKIERIADSGSMGTRAAQLEQRRRYAALKDKIAASRIDELRESRRVLQELQNEQSRAYSALATEEELERESKRERDNLNSLIERRNALDELRKKYRRLQDVFGAWFISVFQGAQSERERNVRHNEFVQQLERRYRPDLSTIKDFIYGGEYGAAVAGYLVALKSILERISTLPDSDSGGKTATGDERFDLASSLVRTMHEVVDRTTGDPASFGMARFAQSFAQLQRIDFEQPSIVALEQQSQILRQQQDIDEELRELVVNPPKSMSPIAIAVKRSDLQRARKATQEQLDMLPDPVLIPRSLISAARAYLTAMQLYSAYDLTQTSIDDWRTAFGEAYTASYGSVLVEQDLQRVEDEIEEVRRAISDANRRADATAQQLRDVRARNAQITTLKQQIDARETELQKAQREIEEMDERGYRDTAEWMAMPRHSGTIDLDPVAALALQRAHSMLKHRVPHTPDINELATDEQYSYAFAELAGAVLQLHSATSGRNYVQPEVVQTMSTKVDSALDLLARRVRGPTFDRFALATGDGTLYADMRRIDMERRGLQGYNSFWRAGGAPAALMRK